MYSFKHRYSGMKYMLADIFFPNRCPFCDDVIPWTDAACDECADSVEYFDGTVSVCRKCGRSMCVCSEESFVTDRIYSGGYYANELRRAVLSMKYHKNENAAEFFAEVLFSQMKHDNFTDFDYIVPVPMNIKKERRRGYNQAEYLAECIGKYIPDAQIRNDLLVRKYSRRQQHDRNAEERHESALTEYSAAEGVRLDGDKILLCDDIFTTGATVNRCADLLKIMGADSVTAAVCCISG